MRIYDSDGAYLGEGPDLVHGRYGHACAVVKETGPTSTHNRVFVMAAGGYDRTNGRTVELLDYIDRQHFKQGSKWELGN